MKLNSFLVGLVGVTAAASAHAGEITGKVTFKGAAPAEPGLAQKTAAIKNDPFCGKHSEGPKNRVFLVGANGEFGQVVVRIAGDVKGEASKTPVLIDQKNCEYTPYITAVQVGQKLTIRNSDDTLHNVHGVPKVAGNKETNKAQLAKSPDLEYVYDNAEDFLTYKCDVHPWMLAYVTVNPNPYFSVSAADGSFSIKNVPAGKYTVEAIHRRAGKQEAKDVEVKDGATTVNFAFEPKAQ